MECRALKAPRELARESGELNFEALMRDGHFDDLGILDSESPNWQANYKNISTRFPTNNIPRVNLFLQLVVRNLDKLNLRTKYKSESEKEQREALKKLQEHDNVVIKCSDKGGSMVILTQDSYVLMF